MSEQLSYHDNVINLLRERGCQDVCEVGVWRGALTRRLVAELPLLRTLVLVDPWSACWNRFTMADGWEYTCTMGENGGQPLSQFDLNLMHREVCERFPSALVLRMPSGVASSMIPSFSLDAVLIDGVHTYQECLRDIRGWLSKVRKGGVICGDDYVLEHEAVAKAVDSVFEGKPGTDGGRIGSFWWEGANKT